MSKVMEQLLIISNKQLEANRRNAQRSTGPKTEAGVLACKENATRHGLRSLQTVVPGEDLNEWEVHRMAILDDLSPQGTVETALAEQVATKLWRLGRVVKYESDSIANAQDLDILRLAHENAYQRQILVPCTVVDIPTHADVEEIRKEIETYEQKASERERACQQLEALATMGGEDAFPDWSIYETILADRLILEPALDRLFLGVDDDGPLRADQARKMLALLGEFEEVRLALLQAWTEVHESHIERAAKGRRQHAVLLRRYDAAIDRRRLSNGLPPEANLDRIQRYEAHLERGMHKALDRLRELQMSRGAISPRGPSVAVAFVQTNHLNSLDEQMGPFGNFAIEGRGDGEGNDPADFDLR